MQGRRKAQESAVKHGNILESFPGSPEKMIDCVEIAVVSGSMQQVGSDGFKDMEIAGI